MDTASTAVSCVGGIVAFIGGYLISFGGHKSSSIWIFFTGCVLLLLGGALYLQGKAWDDEKPKDSMNAAEPSPAPIIKPEAQTTAPSPAPTQEAPKPEESSSMNNSGNVTQQGNGNVYAPNSQANINTGPVNGNLEQNINIAPKPRMLSDDQIKSFLAKSKSLPKGRVWMRVAQGDSEAQAYALQIRKLLIAAGYTVPDEDEPIMIPRVEGLCVEVRSADKPPLYAIVLANMLGASNIPICVRPYFQAPPDEANVAVGTRPQ